MPAGKMGDHARHLQSCRIPACMQASCLNPFWKFSVSDNNGSGFQLFASILFIQVEVTLKSVSPAISLIVVLFLLFSFSFFLRSLYTSLCQLHYVGSPLRCCAVFVRCSGVIISFVKYVSALKSSS